MDKNEIRAFIAKRVAKEFKDGQVVNLGIGLPTTVANYISDDINIILQSENGFLGLGPYPEEGKEDKDIVNAGGQYVTIKKGGQFFDSATSFMIIRGGHVDTTVLGALQVDKEGNLANWMIPGKIVPGMGGAMDLVVGAKKVIVAMEHTQKGNKKILEKCTLPLTATKQVNMIITEMGVFDITEDGLVMIEKNPIFTFEEIQDATGTKIIVSEDLKDMIV
ncbi:3-oxoacid CoA-transferase subunit B [Oceanivirga salmonicida]|uniref:3-oxoacid CoA-transferase subunit B n=1 Tax=Oceanivirga salmonicida TaxID=1769291 RepID=UPI00082AEE0B|nr:3-oxoacid CoA-transferase subunit B [Oceanivirga salmonicida]